MFEYEKREFKRRELEHELAHEDAMERAYYEVLVDGKPKVIFYEALEQFLGE